MSETTLDIHSLKTVDAQAVRNASPALLLATYTGTNGKAS